MRSEKSERKRCPEHELNRPRLPHPIPQHLPCSPSSSRMFFDFSCFCSVVLTCTRTVSLVLAIVLVLVVTANPDLAIVSRALVAIVNHVSAVIDLALVEIVNLALVIDLVLANVVALVVRVFFFDRNKSPFLAARCHLSPCWFCYPYHPECMAL